MIILALLTVLSWTPPSEQPVTAWVNRPVLMECGQPVPCMEYQTVYYKKTTGNDGLSFDHPLDPGDVLFVMVGGCP